MILHTHNTSIFILRIHATVCNSEYSIYQTGYRRGSAGLPICILEVPPDSFHPIQPISSIGRDGEVKFLYSPGFLAMEP